MDDEENTWVALLSAGLGLNTVGLLLLDSAVWYVQYAMLGLGVVVILSALYVAIEESQSD
jgi:hypothetical protein